jgi:hypothetical protein
LWPLKNSGASEYFHHKNGFPGLRLGSIRSKISILCYEKIYIQRKFFNSFKTESEYLEVNKDYRNLLRIEARVKPKKKLRSKK